MDDAADEVVGLASAIEALRGELVDAQSRGRAGSVTFEVGKVGVEFVVETRTTAAAGGGVKFWVVNADAKVDRATGARHTVTVELLPTGGDGQPLRVAGGGSSGPTPE